MAQKIGDLQIQLSAETAAFRRDMEKARSDLKRSADDMKVSMGGFKNMVAEAKSMLFGFGAAAVSVAGVAGLGALVKNSLDSAVALEKNAKMAGVNVEAFQELQYAASRYHITQEALTDGLKELALRGDEFAKTGKGPAAEAFQRLGFGAGEINDRLKDTSKLFTEVIQRMQGLDKAAQIRIADELFGGQGGEQFVAMIQGGSTALSEMRAEARELGIVLDERLIKNADDASQKLDTLRQIIGVQLTSAIVQAAPAIENIAEKLAGFVKSLNPSEKDVLSGEIDRVTSKVAGLRQELENYRTAGFFMKGLADLGGFNSSATEAAITALEDRLKQLKARMEELNSQAGAAEGGSQGAGGTFNQGLFTNKLTEMLKQQQDIRALNKQMYEELGVGAQNVAKDEVAALAKRAVEWEKAGADIEKINQWLYSQIDQLRTQWAEKGEVDAVKYLDSFKWHSRSLVEEFKQGKAELEQLLADVGVKIQTLNQMKIDIPVFLRDNTGPTFAKLRRQIAELRGEVAGLGIEVSDFSMPKFELPRFKLPSFNLPNPDTGTGPVRSETRGGVTEITNIYNGKMSRSDYVNVTVEQKRQLDRS